LIGRLTGRLIELDASVLLVDVAGVAYEVEVSAGVLQTLPEVGQDIILHTHFVVREDAQLLYGFAAKNERDLFRAFIKINGVGPKLGLSLISALDPHALSHAVRSNDVSMLTKVPGVGKKTAERLMVELKNRLETLEQSGAVPFNVVSVSEAATDSMSSIAKVAAEAEDALIALGYRPLDASRAVAQAVRGAATEESDSTPSVQTLVRRALRGFAKSSSST
jgi:Holliday junction DNA helicase RuvA